MFGVEWWYLLMIYLAGAWLVATGLMRFMPRQCTKMTTEYLGSGRSVQVPFDKDKCRSHHGPSHGPWWRTYAGWPAVLWPVVIALAIPGALIFGAVYASAVLGHAEWVKKERS